MSLMVHRCITDKEHSLSMSELFMQLVESPVGLYLVPQTDFPWLQWCSYLMYQVVDWHSIYHGNIGNHCNWEVDFYTVCCGFQGHWCVWHSHWVHGSGRVVVLNVSVLEVGWQIDNPKVLVVVVQVECGGADLPIPFKITGMGGIPLSEWVGEFGGVDG